MPTMCSRALALCDNRYCTSSKANAIKTFTPVIYTKMLCWGLPKQPASQRRHDTQHNDTQHNETQHKELICDTQHM